MKLGNLTPNDVEYTAGILSPAWYPITGALVGLQIAFTLTKFKPGVPRNFTRIFARTSIVMTSGLVGVFTGHLVATRAMRRHYTHLENPDGYQTAIKEIKTAQLAKRGQEVMAINWTYGVIVAQPFKDNNKEGVDEGVEAENGSSSRPPIENAGEVSQPDNMGPQYPDPGVIRLPQRLNSDQLEDQSAPPVGGAPSTRWETIRKEKSSAQPTAWDLIRQRHERQRLPSSDTSDTSDEDPTFKAQAPPRTDGLPPPESNDYGRRDEDSEMSEQEKFNALLEAERRMGARNADKYATWGEEGPTRRQT